jgi:SAM-dependent methyltransferase
MLWMMDDFQLDRDVDAYYSQAWDEDVRLRSGLAELELVRTRALIRRYLGTSQKRVLDVGGGTGVHAEWLLDDGHDVVLIDPVERHVAQASALLGEHNGFECHSGDARQLDIEDGTFDAVLMLGPLYHLTEADDRRSAWHEAIRVVKPGGFVCAAAISRFASLFAGLGEGEAFVDDFRVVIEQDLATGQHRNPPDRDYFTTAFFHHPDELSLEASTAGFADVEVYAVEGPAGAMPQFERHWKEPHKRDALIELVALVEQEPTLMGIGPHLLVFGKKPAA